MPPPAPPNDCRITARCLKKTVGLSLPLEEDLASLRTESTLVDIFFQQREDDERGGEGGERVRQIASKPAFKLTSGRMRGATWFDQDHPPQSVVWLLGAELHDERHKGRSDAYDILGRLDDQGELLPVPIDYKRLELDRRRRDTQNVAADVARDATDLVARALPDGAEGAVAGVPVRLVVEDDATTTTLFVAVSERPVAGRHSGLSSPLTERRFVGIILGFRAVLEERYGPPVLTEELRDRSAFPGGLRRERPFLVYFER
ncbi:MAG: hypothetical protein M3417_05055 [Actinomycetota bacterium]|nr:hypothetical protein [Actinomycetota bacterium]